MPRAAREPGSRGNATREETAGNKHLAWGGLALKKKENSKL